MLKKLFVAVGILLTVMSFIASAQTSVSSVAITGGGILQCTDNVIEARITAVGYNASGGTVGSFSATQNYSTSNGGSFSQTSTLTSGSSLTFYLAIGSGAVSYVDVSLTVGGAVSNTARIYCDGRVELSAGGDGDRMNYANGDLINVLYAATDSVKVYSLDANSKGVYEGSFGYDLFKPYLDNAPAENTFLGQVNYSRLYALTSGEFQIIVDDPVEAKTYTTIFTAFPISNIYYR